jgi:hypothetical protein
VRSLIVLKKLSYSYECQSHHIEWQAVKENDVRTVRICLYFGRGALCMYHMLEHNNTLHYAHKIHLCVPFGSHNGQRFFPLNSINRLISVAEM